MREAVSCRQDQLLADEEVIMAYQGDDHGWPLQITETASWAMDTVSDTVTGKPWCVTMGLGSAQGSSVDEQVEWALLQGHVLSERIADHIPDLMTAVAFEIYHTPQGIDEFRRGVYDGWVQLAEQLRTEQQV